MIVYRVEHNETGMGPYQSSVGWNYEHHDEDDENYPLPEEDIKDYSNYSGRKFSGFESLEQLYNWFNREEDIEFLMSVGFVISYYEIKEDRVFRGKKQLAFYRNRVKPFKKTSLI